MLGWSEFGTAAPDIAAAGQSLLAQNDVAFLATVAGADRPRIHPFVPKIVTGRLVAFIMDSSPKLEDLQQRQTYALHTLPGEEDEEFCISGTAHELGGDPDVRVQAAAAMGFATGVDEHHILFEFCIDRALWTRWLDFGTADHRPRRLGWNKASGRLNFS